MNRIIIKANMKSVVKVTFYVRSANKKSGMHPVFARCSLNGERINLGKVGLELSSPSLLINNRIVGDSAECREGDVMLLSYIRRVQESAAALISQGSLSLKLLRDELRRPAVTVTKRVMFSDLCKEKEASDLKRYQLGKLSYIVYYHSQLAHRRMREYLLESKGSSDIAIDDLTRRDVEGFRDYLLGRYASRSVCILLQRVRSTYRIAIMAEQTARDPFVGVSVKSESREIAYLEEDEIKRLQEVELRSSAQLLVRDIFLFCCFTGLAYSDVRRLTYSDFRRDGDTIVLYKARKKTGQMSKVPLLAPALAILDKYMDSVEEGAPIFSVPSLDVYNKHLARIIPRAGITKHVTSHVARHTFATLMLSYDITIESVSAMLGHSKISTTQVYAKIREEKIKREMASIRERIASDFVSKQAI